jgi:hypothetical protein
VIAGAAVLAGGVVDVRGGGVDETVWGRNVTAWAIAALEPPAPNDVCVTTDPDVIWASASVEDALPANSCQRPTIPYGTDGGFSTEPKAATRVSPGFDVNDGEERNLVLVVATAPPAASTGFDGSIPRYASIPPTTEAADDRLHVHAEGSDEPATRTYRACVSCPLVPTAESLRTSDHPAGDVIDATDGTPASMAARRTSPDPTPAGRGIASDVAEDAVAVAPVAGVGDLLECADELDA